MSVTDKVEEKKTKREIIAFNPPVDWVRQQIEAAGTTIGSVHFKKRENGELRKMSYRLHVTAPSVAKAPKGTTPTTPATTIAATTVTTEVCERCGKTKAVDMNKPRTTECNMGPYKTVTKTVDAPVVAPVSKPKVNKKVVDKANDQMTVLDANKVVRDEQGNIIGRGAWRTIPLENVVRIACKGNEYVINRY